MENSELQYKWLIDGDISYEDMLNSNNIETLFRYEVQSLFLQYEVDLSSKYTWDEICSIQRKSDEIIFSKDKVKPKPKNLQVYISKELDISLKDLFSIHSITITISAISSFEKGNTNKALSELFHAQLFCGRAIGDRFDNAIPLPYQRVILGGVKGGQAYTKITYHLRKNIVQSEIV